MTRSAGAVEEIDGRPQQVFEIGLEPGVAEHAGEGFEDRRQGRRWIDRLVGQRPRVRLVLVRAMAVHLQFEDDAVGRRGGVVGLEAVVEGKVVGSWLVSVGWGRAFAA